MNASAIFKNYRESHLLPSAFVEQALNRDGKDMRFYKRNHLQAIYDDPFDVLMKCSRQTEKSTSLSCRIGGYLYGGSVVEDDGKERPIRVLYFTASQVQAADFSKDRLARVLESPCFTESFAGGLPLWPKERNTRSHMYVDHVAEKMLRNKATCKLRACNQNADRVRGVSADVICGDEIQDILPDLFPVIEEAAARSPLRKRLYAGTPKTFENSIEEHWQRSTMYEWFIKCPACKTYQMLTEKNIGRTWFEHTGSGCICEHCGKPMDPQAGQWVSRGNADAQLHGYRICHIMLPQPEASWQSILEKMDSYPEQQFFNEVLGFSHEHAAVVLTEAQLMEACNNQRICGSWPGYHVNGLSAGVDWGGPGNSATVLTIGAFHDDVFRVFYIRNFKRTRLSTDEIIKTIVRTCVKWRVKHIGADFGGGVKENQDLRRAFKDIGRVVPMQNSGTAKKPVEWDKKAQCVIVARTQTLSNIFNMIQQQKIEFFCTKDMQQFKDGFIYSFQEYTKKGDVIFNHPENRPDDELHSLNYCYLMAAGQTGLYGYLMQPQPQTS